MLLKLLIFLSITLKKWKVKLITRLLINLTKLDLCKKIKEHIKDFFYYEAPIGEDPDKRDYIVSNKKIENLGFAARNSLDDGIEELIKGNKMLKFKNFTNI